MVLLRLVNKLMSGNSHPNDRKYLFNLICISAFLFALLATVINIVANVGFYAVLSSSSLTLIYLSLYLLTRSREKFSIWMPIVFLMVSYPVLGYLWFLNAGHSGTIGLVMVLYTLGIMCIFPKGYHFPLVVLNILIFWGLIILEYYNPNWAIQYESNLSMVIDKGATFTFIVAIMAIILNTLLRGFNHEVNSALNEKVQAERNNKIVARQNQELQNTNLLKDKLFATISHDLRSPINSLKGTLSLLQSKSLTEDELRSLTLSISDRLYHTSNLLENLLSWSNSQLGGTKLKTKKLKMRSVAEACINIYSNQAHQKNIEITNGVDPQHFSFVDEDMLNSVVRNLLSNAIKFTRMGGKIEINSRMEDEKVFLAIKDNGIGMDEQKLKKLFGALHSSSVGTSLEKGVGLGLLICKDFVEKNGGEIFVESQTDQGSTFTISLPAYEAIAVV